MNRLIYVILLMPFTWAWSQSNDSTGVAVDTAAVEISHSNTIYNEDAISTFYAKLAQLGQIAVNSQSKVNIVHIGDSHIQADLQTDHTRRMLQMKFGHGGRGFVFPHRLAGTNGSSDISVTSSVKWRSYRNVSPASSKPVGLGGFALDTNAPDFLVKFSVKDQDDHFSEVRVITPNNKSFFKVALESTTAYTEVLVPQNTMHTIRKGEVLSVIADKYSVSVSAIKKANGLKSDVIRAGRKLKIPTGYASRPVAKSHFIPLELVEQKGFRSFTNPVDINSFYLLPDETDAVSLSGVVIQNDRPGLLYHNIGVNGAKLSDYNKTPLFFDQLPALEPDLIVVALGTNESFDNLSGDLYMAQLLAFINNVRQRCGPVDILVMTPPPSYFKRKYPNLFVADYSKRIIDTASVENYASWDLFTQLGGVQGVLSNARKGLIAQDRVHYTKTGYEIQGAWFAQAIIEGYEHYISNKP